MNSKIWFLLGFSVMAVVSFLFGGCAQADFSIDPNAIGSSDLQARSSLRVSLHAPSSNDVPLVVALGGQTVSLGAYDIQNDAPQDDAVRSFTVKSVNGKNTFARIGAAWGESPDEILEYTIPAANGSVTFMPSVARAHIPSGSVRTIYLVGVIGTVGTADSKVRSGDVATIELVSLVGMDNTPAVLDASLVGPSYVLRRSQPQIIAHPLADTTLRTGKQYLISWGVRADPAGDVSIKQFGLHLDLRDVEACEFQLRRNTRLAEATEINVSSLSESSADLEHGCLYASNDFVVTFRKEEVVRAGTETVFTLRARIMHRRDGASVLSRFLRLNDSRTTEIACVGGHALRLGTAESGVPAVLWSDISEKPHSDVPCRSSKDWIGDALVADLNVSQTLK